MAEIHLDLLTTEETSHYDNLDKMSVKAILEGINNEDKTVPYAVEIAIPQIEPLVNQIVSRMKAGGRLFYIGAGTSGRLGVVDASECPPTFGVPFDMVVGLIAGGDGAIRKAVENAEDDIEQAWHDLLVYDINELDTRQLEKFHYFHYTKSNPSINHFYERYSTHQLRKEFYLRRLCQLQYHFYLFQRPTNLAKLG